MERKANAKKKPKTEVVPDGRPEAIEKLIAAHTNGQAETSSDRSIPPARTPHVRSLNRNPQEFHQAVWTALGRYAEIMQECWGFVPGLTVQVEGRAMVTVDFDLRTLPHNGRRFFVNPDNQQQFSPEEIARHVVEEIYKHKATCKDCGDGRLTIQDRLDQHVNLPPDKLEELLFPRLAADLRRRCQAEGRKKNRK